jgi:DNA-binding beta-propeller fold protein YncE
MAGKFTRRSLLAATALTGCGALAACGRKRAPRYSGWLFIASDGEHGIAVADLAEFSRVTTIPLPHNPRQILRAGEKVFATCPEGRLICEIDVSRLTVAGRVSVAGQIVTAAVSPDGAFLAVAADRPAALHLIDVNTRKVVKTVPLPNSPVSMDVSKTMAAIDTAANTVDRVALPGGKLLGSTALGLRGGVIRIHPGGTSILVGADGQNQIVTLDPATGAILARLPLAFSPTHFCFNSDAGQMFVTGTGEDSIIIVSPYQNEVDQTMVAGHKPYALAVADVNDRNLLFVTNTGSGDLTIFDIDTRGLASSVHIGGKPGDVLITPDGGYALVVDSASGDVSVVRMSSALDKNKFASMGQGARPLFTVFPTGSAPQSAAIIPRAF